MKILNKETKLFISLVIITLVFLFGFNVVYAYFSSNYSARADVDFYKLEINLAYQEPGQPFQKVENQKQLFPTTGLTRNKAVGLKATADATSTINAMGFRSESESISAYVRFWIEVYMVKQLEDETIVYIDSKGNYVTESGSYVDANGNEIDPELVTAGEIVDYAEYFELGYKNGENFNYSSYVERKVNEVDSKKYITYFMKSAINAGSNVDSGINAIKMTSSAPNIILDTNVIIFINMEGVQTTNNAYKTVFDDNYGYYQWVS